MKRREFLSIAAGSFFLADAVTLFAADARASWKVGICDWDLRASGQPSAFAVAKELGFDGVQVSYNPGGQGNSLANKENRQKFLDAAKESGVGIASLAMGILNNDALATTLEAEGWVEDCIDAMDDMDVDRVLLAFFGNGDMNQNKGHQPLVIEKLKRLGPIAAKKGKILGVESYLSAEDNLKLLDAIDCDAVKIYYDVQNSTNMGYDIYREIELLGNLICEIHFKQDHCRLGDGDIDFPRVCELLEKIGYEGWLVVESAAPGDWKESHTANAKFVKGLIGR